MSDRQNSKEDKRQVIFTSDKPSVSIPDMLQQRLSKLMFVDSKPLFKELYERKIEFHKEADIHYIRHKAGEEFAAKVDKARAEKAAILVAIEQELYAARDRGEKNLPNPAKINAEYVEWAKSIACPMFDSKKNPRWPYGNSVNKFLAIFAPFEMVLHSAFEELCAAAGIETPAETRPNARDVVIPSGEMAIVRMEEKKEKLEKKGPPKLGGFPEGEDGELAFIAAVTLHKNEIIGYGRTIRSLRKMIRFLQEEYLHEIEQQPERFSNEAKGKAGEASGGEKEDLVYDDPAMINLFNAALHGVTLEGPADALGRMYQEAFSRKSDVATVLGEMHSLATKLSVVKDEKLVAMTLDNAVKEAKSMNRKGMTTAKKMLKNVYDQFVILAVKPASSKSAGATAAARK